MTNSQELQLLLYAILVGSASLLGWLTRDMTIKKVSWLMLGGWAVANIAVQWLGYNEAPLIIPLVNAVVVVMIGAVGYRHSSALCYVLVLLYLFQESLAVAAFWTDNWKTRGYYGLQNGVFVLRMLALGGWALGDIATHWVMPEPARVRHRSVGS